MAYKVEHLTLSIVHRLSGDTTASAAIPAGRGDGWCQYIYFAMSSLSANVSGDIEVYDARGNRVYIGASNVMSAGGSSAVGSLNFPVEGGGLACVNLIWSGIPGSAAGASATPLTSTIDLYISA